MKATGIFRAGTSGLALAEPNKKSFPAAFQDKSRLSYYASLFNSIEINSSFYKIPRAQTFRKWAEMVSPGFQFTVKLWKGITHEKEYRSEDLEQFMNTANSLEDKKGCLLIQYPAKAPLIIGNLEKLLHRIRKYDPDNSWRIAIEFRHHQWYEAEITDVLDAFHVSRVLHDMPSSIPPGLNAKATFVYLRFHGEKGDYRGDYPEDLLRMKSIEIRKWLQQGMDVYVYFNNTMGNAVQNLKTLNSFVTLTPV